jgi:FkbM family methyltransferase
MHLGWAKEVLNRPGGRALLGRLVSLRASRRWHCPVDISYDGCWIHRFGEDAVADWKPDSGLNLPQALERNVRRWLTLYRPAPGDTVVDVGAGVGIEVILFSRAVGEQGTVLAIEAHPKTYLCLRKTCEHNGLGNVVALNLAVADRTTEVEFEDSPRHLGNSIVANGRGSVRVPARTLDDICDEQGIGRVALLKMNIEGAEQLAIRAGSSVIARTARVAIACHDFKAEKTGNEFFRTKAIVTEFLTQNGFVITPMDADTPWENDHVHAYHPERV